jgi:hypothetical protein
MLDCVPVPIVVGIQLAESRNIKRLVVTPSSARSGTCVRTIVQSGWNRNIWQADASKREAEVVTRNNDWLS